MTVNDLIFLAEGLKAGASDSYVEIARRNSPEKAAKPGAQLAKVYTIKIDKSLKIENGKGSFELKPYDFVFIRRAPSYFPQMNVSINGEVNYPGTYTLKTKNERIFDLLKRAGGLTKFAYAPGATLRRANSLSAVQQEKLRAMANTDSTFRLRPKLIAQNNRLVELNLAEILKHPGGPNDYILRQEKSNR